MAIPALGMLFDQLIDSYSRQARHTIGSHSTLPHSFSGLGMRFHGDLPPGSG